MLSFFRKYVIITYVLAISTPLLIMSIWSMATNTNVIKTVPGLFASLTLFIVCFFLFTKIMGRRADAKASEIVAVYNEACDPHTFIEQVGPVVREIGFPYSEQGTWLLSFYALALADRGRHAEAAQIGEYMRQSVPSARTLDAKIALLVNLEPVALRLLGVPAALEIVIEAQNMITQTKGDHTDRLNFLSWEQGLLEARQMNDSSALIEKYYHVRRQATYPLRMRVLAAFDEAQIHRNRHDESMEKECLLFVVEKGNKLPCVEEARSRLSAL